MTRIAIVTGGTRGIGAAIAQRLHARGDAVAATYHGNVAAAEAFERETGKFEKYFSEKPGRGS